MIVFVMKILGYILALNSAILFIVWILKALDLFTAILIYEALFVLILGVLQILSSYIYREDNIPYRWGSRTGWFDFRRFAKLKPEERQRYRREGTIMVIIGIILCVATIIVRFSMS